jgi:putative ABC transport system substrate-binding protein
MALAGGVVVWPFTVRAQDGGKIKRIGFLRAGTPPATFIDNFRSGLRDLGLIEGQNIALELGIARSVAQLPEVASELVRRKVDVIFTSGSPSVLAARKAAGAIPVVFVGAIDPITTGLAASLARPGGNITGITAMHAGLSGKRFELLKELLPKLSKVAVLAGAASPATADVVFTSHRSRIAELALKHRLPSMFGFRDMAEAGGLMAYGPDYGDLYRRGAAHVLKILQGAKPADMPIEQPTKFEFVINLKTAKALGLAIPPILLARADEVIE